VETWDQIFRELRAEFVRRSVPRLERAGNLLDNLAADRTDFGVLSAFRRELQDLAGHGGRYGSPAVAALAEEGERACADLLDRDQSPASTDLERWRSLLRAIRAGMASS
jgi:hypothetical protein